MTNMQPTTSTIPDPAPKPNVIYRGSLTVEKLKDLCYKHLDLKSESDKYSPEIHPEVVSLIKQEDGNWKGYMLKNGVLIESRDLMPEHVLTRLLTHA
jgi:hypothetical protein